MGSLDRIGSTDPRGERAAQESQRETLDEIEEEIGTERYHEIISKLSTGDYGSLSDDDKRLIEKIKRQITGTHH